MYESIQFDDLFGNEVGFYTEILPILQKLSDGKFAAPKYYYSELKENFALLILGDFGADGWSMSKQRYGLNLDHARIAGELESRERSSNRPKITYFDQFQ